MYPTHSGERPELDPRRELGQSVFIRSADKAIERFVETKTMRISQTIGSIVLAACCSILAACHTQHDGPRNTATSSRASKPVAASLPALPPNSPVLFESFMSGNGFGQKSGL